MGMHFSCKISFYSINFRLVFFVLPRLGAERFMGSSFELQTIVMVDGSKLLFDGSLEVCKNLRANSIKSSLVISITIS